MNNKNLADANGKEKLMQGIRETDRNYRMLFENHDSVMMLIDAQNGNIVEANKAAIEYYGYTKEKLLSMRIQNINILSEADVNIEINRAKTEQRSYFQFVHRLANSQLREVEVHSFPVEVGNRKLLFSTIYDITDRFKQKLLFETLFFDTPYAVAILDQNQRIVNINKNFTALFSYKQNDAAGMPIGSLVATEEVSTEIEHNLQMVFTGEVVKQEGIRRSRDGRLIDVEILGYPIINHNTIIGAYVIYIDISDKKRYEKQLLLFKNILENNSEGVVITDNEGFVQWINNAFTEITGYTSDEILNKNISVLKSGIHSKEFYKELWDRLLSEGKWIGEITNLSKNGKLCTEWLTINSIKNDLNKTTNYVGILKDLSEKQKLDRRMDELKQKDALTHLYNRSYFIKAVEAYIHNSASGFSIIFLDIEGFKDINDSLGHQVGDKLLIGFSEILLSFIDENKLLCRFSSDEFAILLKNARKEEAYDLSRVLLNRLKRPFIIEGMILHVNSNIGISRFPENGTNAEDLVRYADIAVYRAKEKQEDRICFYTSEMSDSIEEKFLIANHLALAVDKNELSINYQPIFDINLKNKIVGAEALMRWKNPILGAVSPEKFIPIAEKTGLIIDMGKWIFEEVCKQLHSWQRRNKSIVPISVNISVKQLEQIDFAEDIIKIMEGYSITADNIELEITESVSSGELIVIVNNIHKIKQHGLRISMDDFGTGFSSLGQLDIFELDKLKIDKIFIDDLVKTFRRQNLVKTIIAMAKSLDLTVVAEGIETMEQLNYLKALGCHLGQGYLLSEPLTADGIEALLNANMQE